MNMTSHNIKFHKIYLIILKFVTVNKLNDFNINILSRALKMFLLLVYLSNFFMCLSSIRT